MITLRLNPLITQAKRLLPWVALFALGLQGVTATAQTGWPDQSRASETASGGYILRANAYQSQYLPEAMAQKYDLEQSEGEGLLHVVVLEEEPNGGNETVPAEVEVEQQNLLGQLETLEMRKVEEDSYITYLGTFSFEENSGFRFSITAQPDRSPAVNLSVEFEDSFLYE